MSVPLLLLVVQLASGEVLGQGTPSAPPARSTAGGEPWDFNLTVDAYVVPGEPGYVDPVLAADHGWLHLEARYNYENLNTASFWVGRNFSVGKKLVLNVTPMIGGIFGRTTGIAPGFEGSLTYKKLQLSISNEYVFDTASNAGSFYYSWPQLTYSPADWLHIGLVAQHTKAFQTPLQMQRGFLVGVGFKNLALATYVFNAGWTKPTVVVECSTTF